MSAENLEALRRRLGIAPACARVLQALLAAEGEPLDALALMGAAGCPRALDANVITVHISRLRAALKHEGLRSAVVTIYGRGYAIGARDAAAIGALAPPETKAP